MNYKVVFHKITWSKFMLIFPLFFLFWRWDENNLLRFWHLYIRCDLRDVRCYASATTALSTLQMFRGCFTIHWPLLVAKILIFPKELTRKMQIEGTQTWIYICMHVIRKLPTSTNRFQEFSNLLTYLVTYLWNTGHLPVAWLHFLSFCNS